MVAMYWQRHIPPSLLNASDARFATSLPVIVPRLAIQYQLTVALRAAGRHRPEENIMRLVLELASQDLGRNLELLMIPSEVGLMPRARQSGTGYGSGTTTTSTHVASLARTK